jgi:hypothetical protein
MSGGRAKMDSTTKNVTAAGRDTYHFQTQVGHGIYHPSARPMEVVKDDHGEWWLCDKGVDTHHNLLKQGCWRCGELAFTRDD